MNIFYVDPDPYLAAQILPDRHVVKMPVESVQMLVSALLRYNCDHGVLTKAGTIHKGGYPNHPCTIWTGNNKSNFSWLLAHGFGLCQEYTKRYGKVHFAEGQLETIKPLTKFIPEGEFTAPFLAMPDHLKGVDPVLAYRGYINAKVAEKPGIFVWKVKKPNWLVP
jgi:hypothetical protein